MTCTIFETPKYRSFAHVDVSESQYVQSRFALAIAIFIGDWSGWWFGTFFIFPYIGNNHPNWLHIFQRGRYTTNQWCSRPDWFWGPQLLLLEVQGLASLTRGLLLLQRRCRTWGFARGRPLSSNRWNLLGARDKCYDRSFAMVGGESSCQNLFGKTGFRRFPGLSHVQNW